MKKNLVLLLSVLFFTLFSCKTKAPVSNSTTAEETKKVQPPCALPLTPEYAEGNDAMYAFINENLKYPEEAKKNNISGTVYVTFMVLVSGELINIGLGQGIGYGCDEEAVRIVKLMPKWKPGQYLNKPIDMNYSLGIIFGNK